MNARNRAVGGEVDGRGYHLRGERFISLHPLALAAPVASRGALQSVGTRIAGKSLDSAYLRV
jgi:hypothetical protein